MQLKLVVLQVLLCLPSPSSSSPLTERGSKGIQASKGFYENPL